MANRQTKQINEYAGVLSQALQNAYASQANAISEASRIQSETANKNRELYQQLSDDIVSRFEAINEQNISYFKDASSQANQYLMPFINAARDPAPDSTLLRDLLGVNGFSAQQTATQNYLQSPQVQAALDMGVKAIDKSSAAAGMTQSGRVLQELHNQGQQIATQSLGDYQNRLLTLFQTDQQGYLTKYSTAANAANALSQIGSGFAGQMSQSGLEATKGATGAIGSFGDLIGQQNTAEGNFLSNAKMQLGTLNSNYQMQNAAQIIEARKAANSMLSPDAWQASGLILGAGSGAGGIFSTGGGNISGLVGPYKMAGVFSDGSFQDYFGETDASPQGSYGSPGVFSYGQYNQEQAMRRMNPKDLASMQTQQMTQQKKAMEMQKMQEDRQMEMAMKQAVSEASKYGPDAIASVYEQFGDAKTAMDIRKSAQGLVKGGLETKKLMLDVESAKRAAVMNQVAARISSLPANQRAQEWASIIPQINAQMGTELPEEYSSGNLMGMMAVQQGTQESLRTMLSNPQTAPLAEPALRAMADPAVDKYFNDLIAAKKASLGPDLVTRENQVPMTREESQAAIADYQRRQADDGTGFQDYYKLSPETEKAKEQAQYELGQERQAQAQELSNAMAELSSKENPTVADIARVKALAESVRAGQTPLVVAANEARDAKLYSSQSDQISSQLNQTKTFTTKTDAKGNVSFSESVKESPEKFNKDEALAQEMASLQDSLSGLDLPPSTWEDPEKNKPLSAVGKLQYDAARAKTPEERAQLQAAAAQQAKTGGSTIIQTETPDLVYAKNAVAAQEKAFQIEDSIRTVDNLMSKFDPDALTIEGKVGNAIVNFAERTKIFKGLASDEQIQKAIEGDAFMSGIDRAMVELTQGKMVGALTDRDWRNLVKGLANGSVSTGQFIQRMKDVRSEMEQSLAVAKQRASGNSSSKPYVPSDSDFEKVLSIYDDPNASPDKIKKADQFIMKYGHLYK